MTPVLCNGIGPNFKTTLDESRLLILGAQVLFGLQFQAVFRDLFREVSWDGKLAQWLASFLILVAVGLLITPSMVHQLSYQGKAGSSRLMRRQAWLSSVSCRWCLA
jgi:hypothetical protein